MRWVRRLTIVALLILLAPVISVLASTAIARFAGCELHEGFVNPCVIGGTDIGETLTLMFVAGWYALITLPVAAILGSAWGAVEMGRWLYLRRQRRRH